MPNLITKTDIAARIPLAANLDSERIDLFAGEQEVLRCTELLGRELYADIKTESPTPDYTKLLELLKPVLVYWTYVMYLRAGKVFNTASGAVIKRNDYSLPMDAHEFKAVVDSNCEMARFYESELKTHLNEAEYPLYKSTGKHTGCKVFRIKTTD